MIFDATGAVVRTLPHGSFSRNSDAGRWRDGGSWMSVAGSGSSARSLLAAAWPAPLWWKRHLPIWRSRGARSDRGTGRVPLQFILGDFAVIAGTLPDADVVTLDRVVCCYPDGESLLREAAARTRQLLAFTYPRDRWYVRMIIALENFWRRLTGSKFRAFVHQPQRMAGALEAAGLVRDARRKAFVWILELYRREGAI